MASPASVIANQFAPSLAPVGGAIGLNVNIGSGNAVVGPRVVAMPATSLSLPANSFNYIFVDLNYAVMVVTSNTTGFTTTCFPIATAVTSGTQVVTLTNLRGGAFMSCIH